MRHRLRGRSDAVGAGKHLPAEREAQSVRPKSALPVLFGLVLVTAGCAGTPASEPTDGPTATPTAGSAGQPTGTVDFADGPKEPPPRPSALNASSVREYVRTHEYRHAYNSLWVNGYTEVTLDCRVGDVGRRAWGYEAVVTCTGSSNTRVPENATVTPGPHADWFTRSYRYRVSETATERTRVENRDPVS